MNLQRLFEYAACTVFALACMLNIASGDTHDAGVAMLALFLTGSLLALQAALRDEDMDQ